jgi:hypothetical protein
MYGCIITTGGANTPVATWTLTTASFTDVMAAVYHTTGTWNSTFIDQSAISLNNTSTTTCPTGTTAATTNAHDLLVAICLNFNVGETWGALSGYTNRAGSSRNTSAWYDSTTSTTGTQSTTIPLSSTDFSLGMIAAFASSGGGGGSAPRSKAVIF